MAGSQSGGAGQEIGSLKESGKCTGSSVTITNAKGGYVYVRPLSSGVDCMVSIDGKGEVSAKTLNENQMSMAVSMPKISSISNDGYPHPAGYNGTATASGGVGGAFPTTQTFTYSGDATSTPEPVTTKIYFSSSITLRASNNSGNQFEYATYIY